MSEFVNKILAELKTNENLKSELLIKMIVESTEKSIALGESNEKIYQDLKSSIVSLNEKVNNPNLEVIVSQFLKNETTTDSTIHKIATEANLSEHINLIKGSNIYSNPVIKTQVDLFESYLNSGSPDFALCESFIASFNLHSYDATIKKSISSIGKYLNENAAKLKMLNTIYRMDSSRSPIYSSISNDLKEMLISESYSADVLKIKYGVSIPLVNELVNDLRIIESAEFGSFTIGEGNGETRVNNLIAPAIKTADGILIYTDNRFLSIREENELTGKESKVHVNENFKISDLSPEFVKSEYGKFYDICEAYATLGFTKNVDGLSVSSTLAKGVRMSFKLNEEKNLDIYINDSKFEKETSLYEALAFESGATKSRVNLLLENVNNIFHLEFIKEITNDRTLSEAMVLNLNDSYYVCDKVNAADRVWTKVDEHQLNQFFNQKFSYDVSNIFKVKIDESIQLLKNIEEKKKAILLDIEKLEKTATKLDETINSNEIDSEDSKKLQSIKESILATIESLKVEYSETDLVKKKVA
jgi:hypothetical protein